MTAGIDRAARFRSDEGIKLGGEMGGNDVVGCIPWFGDVSIFQFCCLCLTSRAEGSANWAPVDYLALFSFLIYYRGDPYVAATRAFIDRVVCDRTSPKFKYEDGI